MMGSLLVVIKHGGQEACHGEGELSKSPRKGLAETPSDKMGSGLANQCICTERFARMQEETACTECRHTQGFPS